MGILDGLLDGLGWIWDNTVGAATEAVWDQVVGGLVSWVVDAIAWFVQAILRFFERSSTPDLASNWFAGGGKIGPRAESPYGVVAWLALSILLACVLVSIVHGLLAGEGPSMAARLARDVPLAILGIVATIGVAQVLLGATDELAHLVLDNTNAGRNAKQVMQQLGEIGAFENQATFVVFLLGLVGVVAAVVLWVELLIRASLIYLLIAISPLAYACVVWPAARRVAKRLAELVLALMFAKVVIAVALAVAASALSRGPTGVGGAEKIGTLLIGVVMFCLACFAPFVLLKLLPVVEAAVVAQGISRGPARAAQSAAMTSFYMGVLAGAAGGGGSHAALAAGTGAAPGASAATVALAGHSTVTGDRSDQPSTTESTPTVTETSRLEAPVGEPRSNSEKAPDPAGSTAPPEAPRQPRLPDTLSGPTIEQPRGPGTS